MRTLKLAAMASIGLLALGACGSEQGAAMFVGDERIPETTVDGYIDEIAQSEAEQGGDLAGADFADVRYQAVAFLLFTEIGRLEGVPETPTGSAANEREALMMEATASFEALYQRAEPRALTAEEQAAFDEYDAADPGMDMPAQMREQYAGFVDDLVDYIEEYDISVNPRYGEIELSPFPTVFSAPVPQR